MVQARAKNGCNFVAGKIAPVPGYQATEKWVGQATSGAGQQTCFSVWSGGRLKGSSLRSPPMALGRRLRLAACGRARPRRLLLAASMPSNVEDRASSPPLTGLATAPTRPLPTPLKNPAESRDSPQPLTWSQAGCRA